MASFHDVPEELLVKILECLLPQVTRSDLDEEYVLEQTRALFNARAVCKTLCRLATPLAWRRLRLRIRVADIPIQGHLNSSPNPQLLSSFAAPGVGGSYPSRTHLGHPVRPHTLDSYVPFILDQPSLVSSTRFLILDFPEWDSPNYALGQCAERIAGSLNSFEFLRVIFVLYFTQQAPPTFLSALMRLPQPDLALHISQCRIDPGGPPPPVSTVKYLQFTESTGMFPAIAHARSLTHLWLERCPGDNSAASQLPWHSLISVGMCDCPDQFWAPFFTGFFVFQRAGNIAPLTELSVGSLRTPLSPEHVSRILETFGCQQLTRLDLFHVGDDSSPSQTLSQIAATFPTLNSLTLLSDEHLGGWTDNFDDCVQALQSLSSLRYLCWNNVHGWEPKADLDAYTETVDHRNTWLLNTADPLAIHLSSLQEIRFAATWTRFCHSCIITRFPKPSIEIVEGSLDFLNPNWLVNQKI